jgi:hypothetical protein
VKDLLGRSDLHDPPGVDDGDAVGQRQRFLAVVRHIHRSDSDSLLQCAKLVAQLEAHLVIEIRHRLVEQQQARIDRKRATQGDALPLPARKLRHRARPEILELQQFEHLGHPLGDCFLLPVAHAQTVADVVCDAHMRPQGVRLKHHRRFARLGRKTGDFLAIDANRSRVRKHEAGDGAEQGRLAAARAAEQRDHLAALHA